jgi:hypothetical protein
MLRGLAGNGLFSVLIRQRDSESATLAWFKYIHEPRHVIRREPRG